MISLIGNELKNPVMYFLFLELSYLILINDKRLEGQQRMKDLIYQGICGLMYIIIICVIDFSFVYIDTTNTTLELPICILTGVLFGKYILQENLKKAIYNSLWSFFLAEMVTQIEMPIMINLWTSVPSTIIIAIDLLIYLIFWIFTAIFLKYLILKQNIFLSKEEVRKSHLILLLVVTIFYLFLSNYQLLFYIMGTKELRMMIAVYRSITCLFCFSLIVLQSIIDKGRILEKELQLVEQLNSKQEEQYKISKENIEVINQKCHDMKYQIRAIRLGSNDHEINLQLEEMENRIKIYDAIFKTNNKVLDMVLTEKSLLCQKYGIRFSCMIDATKLVFIDAVDLYSLFGNAIDNAIEYVKNEIDIQKRIIQIKVFSKSQFVMIEIENYCDKKLSFVDGIPRTTKEENGYHGYGIKSIRYIAEKYEGVLEIKKKEKSFLLQILMPVKRT